MSLDLVNEVLLQYVHVCSPWLFYFFLVLDCTRKIIWIKHGKNTPKTWMKSPKDFILKEILDEIAKLWMRTKL